MIEEQAKEIALLKAQVDQMMEDKMEQVMNANQIADEKFEIQQNFDDLL